VFLTEVVLARMQRGLQAATGRASEPSIPMVRLILRGACFALLLVAFPASAAATPVLVFDHGRVTRENDPFEPADVGPLPPRSAAPAARAAQTASAKVVLRHLLDRGQIDKGTYDTHTKDYDDAVFIRAQLGGTPRRELGAVISQLNGFASHGQLTASRVPILFLQLNRNTEWWGLSDRIPGAGERVRFRGSRILWQYVPGQGLQFHPLANWGRAEALIKGGFAPNAQEFIAELLPLAADRGGASAWEYYFSFGGGRPPWTSGLSQGTALIVLAASARQFGDPASLDAARRALRLYQLRTPTGVRVPRPGGAYYAEYSFSPGVRIINGWIQALNGLWDMQGLDPRAAVLFRAGDRAARRALPYYDTGRWSRYDNSGVLSPLNYHVLLRDFLQQLCQRSHIGIYCSKAARFSRYLRRGPPRGVG
jgi:D-glucuronyl C5-epimerase C-terminus